MRWIEEIQIDKTQAQDTVGPTRDFSDEGGAWRDVLTGNAASATVFGGDVPAAQRDQQWASSRRVTVKEALTGDECELSVVQYIEEFQNAATMF